jgi:hypothetical protein
VASHRFLFACRAITLEWAPLNSCQRHSLSCKPLFFFSNILCLCWTAGPLSILELHGDCAACGGIAIVLSTTFFVDVCLPIAYFSLLGSRSHFDAGEPHTHTHTHTHTHNRFESWPCTVISRHTAPLPDRDSPLCSPTCAHTWTCSQGGRQHNRGALGVKVENANGAEGNHNKGEYVVPKARSWQPS